MREEERGQSRYNHLSRGKKKRRPARTGEKGSRRASERPPWRIGIIAAAYRRGKREEIVPGEEGNTPFKESWRDAQLGKERARVTRVRESINSQT